MISFCTVRLSIRFSYYFYVLTKNSAALLASRTADTAENKRYKKHLLVMYLNMLSPLLVVIFYLTPLIESLFVPDYMSVSSWKAFRLVFVIGVICLRTLTFREEIQFHFNESYFYVQKLMTDKNEKVFRYIKLRIQENFLTVWYTIFQQAANYIIPILLILCYINRLVAFTSESAVSNFELSKVLEKINQAGGPGKYDIFGDSESLGAIFSEMGQKGVLTA